MLFKHAMSPVGSLFVAHIGMVVESLGGGESQEEVGHWGVGFEVQRPSSKSCTSSLFQTGSDVSNQLPTPGSIPSLYSLNCKPILP